MQFKSNEKSVNNVIQATFKTVQQPDKPAKPASLEKLAAWMKFETFGDSDLIELVEWVGEWAGSYQRQETPRWLVMLGNSGNGKTYIADFLWQWVKSEPRGIQYSTSDLKYQPKLIHWPSLHKNELLEQDFSRYRDMQRWPVLVLDDIGGERDKSGFSADNIYTLLDNRLRKWTIITSNLNIEKLSALDVRIASRIFRHNSIVVVTETIDYHMRKRACVGNKSDAK